MIAPSRFIRSASGLPAELIRTRHDTYRLWYGNVLGTHEWTPAELEKVGAQWLDSCPEDLTERTSDVPTE